MLKGITMDIRCACSAWIKRLMSGGGRAYVKDQPWHVAADNSGAACQQTARARQSR